MKSTPAKPRATGIPATEVWFELRKVLGSKQLRSCPTLRRFLCFVVEETMAGRGNRLSEYVVGVQVFGRPASYDPRLDSRVRVEAHRLRDALAGYYREQGRSDPVLIEISTGSYTPSFRYRKGPEPQQSLDSAKEDVP
jgi:serine/threonine-protein kinase